MKNKFFILIVISLFFQLSTYAILIKIDSSGKYCPFPGITVVSNIQERNYNMWKSVHEKLSKNSLITDYFAPLPLESYHMTMINLYTKRYNGGKKGMKWNSFFKSKLLFLENLKNSLEANSFEPYVNSAALLKPEVSTVIKLLVPLDNLQREKIQNIAQQHGLTNKIPNPFHVTLAYSYKKIPDKIMIKIEKQVNNILKPILNSSSNSSLIFNKPKINYFFDMTKFIEWNKNIKEVDI